MTTFGDRLTDSFLIGKRGVGDPLVDPVIQEVFEQGDAELADRIFHLLIRNLEIPLAELPPPLASFIREQAEASEGVPAALAADTERVFRDHGPRVLLALYHASLPTAYDTPGIAKLLVATGRLAYGGSSVVAFSRRIAETGQYVIDVLGPDGMRPGGAGITNTLKVRLIHGAIRHFTRAAAWDVETLGVPINQLTMALTLTTFGITIVDALDALGTPLPDADAAAYLATWNAVGSLLGIEEDLLPPAAADARLLQARILELESEATPEGALLARALVEYVGGLTASRDIRDAPALLIRYLVGSAMAARLGVPRPRRWWAFLVPFAMRRLFGLLERLEDASQPVAVVSDRISGHIARGMVASFNEFKAQPFRVPDSLLEAWEIERAGIGRPAS